MGISGVEGRREMMKKKDIASKDAKRKAATCKEVNTPGGRSPFGECTDRDRGVRQKQDAAGAVALICRHKRADFKLIDVVSWPKPAVHPFKPPDPEATREMCCRHANKGAAIVRTGIRGVAA